MLKKLVALALWVGASSVYALDWICTTPASPVRVAIAAAEHGSDGTSAAVASKKGSARARPALGKLDLMQAYSGQPVLMGHTWLLAVMLPASHPDTRAAFSELGLSAEAAERMASGSGLVDRGIRVVQTPTQMIEKVSNNPPAVGYTGFFTGGRDVALCF